MSTVKSFFSHFKIDLLNTSNYFKWGYQSQLVFEREGLWEYINPAVATELKPGEELKDEKAKTALTSLKLLIEPGYMLDFQDVKCPVTLWRKIKEKETALSAEKETIAMTELEAVSYDGKEDISKYFERFNKILERIKARGSNVPETFLTGCMIKGLPDEWIDKYEPILNGYRSSVDRLKIEIQRIETSYKEKRVIQNGRRPASETTPRALTAHNEGGAQHHNKKGGGYNRSNKSPKIFGSDPKAYCQIHQGNGHDTKDCYFLRKVNEYNSKKGDDDKPGSNGGGRNSEPKLQINRNCMVRNLYRNPSSSNPTKWYIDSGASDHYSGDLSAFTEYQATTPYPVLMGNESTVYIQGRGTVVLPLLNGTTLTLTQVNYAPEFGSHSLMSVRRAGLAGIEVLFSGLKVILKENNVSFATGSLEEGSNIYKLDLLTPRAFSVNQGGSRASTSVPLKTMHRRFGHINYDYILNTGNHTTGFELKDSNKEDCDPCLMSKATRATMRSTDKTPLSGEELHIDIWGNAPVPSLLGNLYVLTGTDPSTRYRQAEFLKDRKSFLPALKKMILFTETQTGYKIKKIRLDSAPEFTGRRLKEWSDERGISLQFTSFYTPEQNGTSERGMRTIAEAGRSILEDSHLPYEFWEEAFATSIYCYNRCYIPATGSTPYEAHLGSKPDVSHLRIFGSLAYVTIPKETNSWHKLKAKAWRGIHCGYGGSGWRIYNPLRREFYTSNHVTIKEHQRGAYLLSSKEVNSRHYGVEVDESCDSGEDDTDGTESTLDFIEVDVPDYMQDNHESESNEDSGLNNVESGGSEEPELESDGEVSPTPPPQRTPEPASSSQQRKPKPTKNNRGDPPEEGMTWVRGSWIKPRPESRRIQGQRHAALAVRPDASRDPTTIKEALTGADKDLWRVAIKEEMDSLLRNGTWDLVKRPQNRNIVSCKWVFKIKSSGRFKARLVARGFTQTEGVDYFETYAPVCSWDSIRMVLALAARNNLKIQQMDVQTAFLYGELDEEIYMEQPEGYDEDPTLVCKLNKSLYGLKQAPRVWNKVINSYFEELGLQRSRCDPGMYIRKHKGANLPLIVLIYVDDLLIIGDNSDEIDEIKLALHNKFDMTDIGDLKNLLGMEISRMEDGSLFIHHSKYVQNLLKRWNMEDSSSCDTPMVSGGAESGVSADLKQYQQLNGGINWPSICTRPDISFPAGYLGRFNQNPDKSHVTAQKRVLRYLKRTRNCGLFYDHNNLQVFIAYADADFAGDSKDRKSTSGGIIFIYGTPVIWYSRKQDTVAISTVEAEYYALATMIREMLWVMQWFEELGISLKPMVLKVDSMGALQLAKNGQLSRRSKHIDVKHHFIQQHIEAGDVLIEHVPTGEMVADIMTKPLDRYQFRVLKEKMNLWEAVTEDRDQ